MAVAFDAQSFLDFTTTNSWTHTPVGVPRLAVVMVAQEVSSADRISAVTYGGQAMKRVNWAPCDSAEPGATYIYWLREPPSGAQTVSVTVSAGTEAKVGWAVTATANGGMKVVSWAQVHGVGAAATIANPTSTLGTPASFAGIVCNALFSGAAAPATPTTLNSATKLTGTDAGGKDFGLDCACASYNIQSGAAVTSGWTNAADDVAMASAAFAEELWMVARLFVPSDLSGLTVWLKADAIIGSNDGDPLATWTDSSAASNNATAGNAPTYKTNIQNGLPIVRYDGINDQLNLATNPIASAAYTIFLAIKTVGAGADQQVVQTNDDSFDLRGGSGTERWGLNAGAVTLASGSQTAFSILTLVATNAANPKTSYQNGVQQATLSTSTTNPAGTFAIGRAAANQWSGDIGELIVYNSALSATDRQKVENYLIVKYGL